MRFKPKIYHPKCKECKSQEVCGEGEYLRLNVNNKLIPCLYRPDLEQAIYPSDSIEDVKSKVALGFRRINFDDI